MKRIFAGFVAIAMVLTLVGSTVAPAQAATVEELQAMIAQLTAQIASLMGGSSSTSGYSFTRDLTMGSTGTDVVELQKVLVSKGYLVMPAGVAMGYFGTLTKNAVAAWQASAGITPAVGYVGPKSRAALNAAVVVTPPTTTPGSTTGITTPGVEGTLTVELNPSPASGVKAYEGDTKSGVLGIKLQAKLSDIKVERLKVQLPNASFYNKIASRMYVLDGGNVVASADLNSSTVVKEGSNYFITLSGMNFIVPKDSTKVLTVAVDLYGSIDSADIGNKTLTVPVDGVRGIDGAGVNQYGPSSSFSRTFSVESDLADSAALQLSLNSGTVQNTEVVASQGSSEDEYDGLTLMSFDLKAEDDDILVTDFTALITKSGSGYASATTAYLYDGSNLVGSATVSNSTSGYAVFSDIDMSIAKNSTKTLALKVDIDDANGTSASFVGSATSTSAVAEASDGDSVTPTGSATGETITVRNVGAMFTLVSKTIEKSATASQNNYSTSTAKGTFTVKVKALGGDLTFGTQATGTASTTFTFGTYKGSTNTTLLVASTSSFTIPSGVVTSGVGSNSFTLQENNEVTIPVEFLFEGRTSAGVLVSTDTYSVGIESIRWSTNAGQTLQTSTFMAGETDWRTSGVSLP